MNASDLIDLFPLIIIASFAIIIMIVNIFYRKHEVNAVLAISGLLLAFMTTAGLFGSVPGRTANLLTIDSYALFFMGLFFAATLAITALSYGYNKTHEGSHEAFYILLLIAVLGSAVLAASSHFVSFFLGLEMLSISLYALIAYRRGERSNEAGIKYLVLAGLSSSFLLFGMALVYAQTGTMEFSEIASVSSASQVRSLAMSSGVLLIIVGAGFKLALVPFHMWTPDVYEGSPAPISAFVATVSKGAVFALILRFFTLIDIQADGRFFLVFTIIAVASMFTGNLLALYQNNIKRVLAYSSIAHLGYLLVAFLSNGALAITAVSFYLTAYFITIIGAFGVITVLSRADEEREFLDQYRGLAQTHPLLSGVFTAMLLSFAGIPLTAGFIGKFYLVSAGVNSALWLLIFSLVVNSAISIFYYLRIIAALYEAVPEKMIEIPLPLAGTIAISALMLMLMCLGIYPSQLIRLIQITAATLG
ncbi:MAG: NADH-quinone oxidoreductase subunit N [Deltaproteobacteria bacterium]|nr:NADH-quinone oxidoreductase subunit N [Deltaproteobacteria bacterium]